MDDFCQGCGGSFRKHPNPGWVHRYKISSMVSPDLAKVLWPRLVTYDGYVCNKCFSYMQENCSPVNKLAHCRQDKKYCLSPHSKLSIKSPPCDSSPSSLKRKLVVVETPPVLQRMDHQALASTSGEHSTDVIKVESVAESNPGGVYNTFDPFRATREITSTAQPQVGSASDMPCPFQVINDVTAVTQPTAGSEVGIPSSVFGLSKRVVIDRDHVRAELNKKARPIQSGKVVHRHKPQASTRPNIHISGHLEPGKMYLLKTKGVSQSGSPSGPQTTGGSDLNAISHGERLKGGRCLHCLKLFTRGVNGWRRVPLSSLSLFNVHKHSLQQSYGVSNGFLCIACVFFKFSSGELSASKVFNSPFEDPPVCLQCCKLLKTNYEAITSVSLSTLQKSCGVEFLLNCMHLFNTTHGVVCQQCVKYLVNRGKSKPWATLPRVAKEEKLSEKPTVEIRNSNQTLSSISKKIASMTLTSGKVVYGSSKRAAILQELRRLKSRCASCESRNCKKSVKKIKPLKPVKKNKKGTAGKTIDNTKLEFYANSIPVVRDRVTESYSTGDYGVCIHWLAKRPRALWYMKRAVRKAVKLEAKAFKKVPQAKLLMGSKLTNELLAKFSWSHIIKEAQTYMPTLVGMLSEIMPTASVIKRRQKEKIMFEESADMQAQGKFGLILSLIANCLLPKLTLVQVLLGLEVWKHGGPPELLRRFSQIGLLPASVRSGLLTAQRLKREAVLSMEYWKQDVTRVPSQQVPDMQPDDTNGSLVELHNKQKTDLEEVKGLPPLKPRKKGLGFCLFWKEIMVEMNVNRYLRGKPSKAVVLFAVRNRANFKHLSAERPPVQAKEVPLEALLPSSKDYNNMQRRMVRVAARILVKHLRTKEDVRVVKDIQEVQPIEHRYTEQMRQKSEIVHLGLMKEDPSTHRGFNAILQELSKYVPVNEHGQPMPTPLYADSQTVKRMLTMNQDADETNSKVQGLLPVIHEFGRIKTCFKELMNLMYRKESKFDKGTICYLMDHSSLTSVFDSEDPDKTKAFIQLITEVHVVMLARHIAAEKGWVMEELVNRRNSPGKLATALVKFLWCEDHRHQVKEVVGATRQNLQSINLQKNCDVKVETCPETEDDGCYCGENKDEAMIRCAFLYCPARKFHIGCVGITDNAFSDDEWYCSDKCEALASGYDTYTFCRCHKYVEDLTMIQCELAGRCTGHQWYHLSCIGMKEGQMPDSWFCSDACKAQRRAPTQDYMQNYTKELTWQGLKFMTRLDAIHEGDGEAMLGHWKLDLLHFWNKNNWDYLIPAHSFLSGVHWTHSPRLANELIWNRVANVTGMPGDNVGMDEVDDLVNRDFRDMAVRSLLTSTQAHRHNECGGRIASPSHLFYCKEQSDLHGRRQNSKNHKEVAKLISECEDLQPFKHVPGRHHPAFPKFKADHTLRDPQRLADDLKKLGELLDRE